jgi:hypothetical protein
MRLVGTIWVLAALGKSAIKTRYVVQAKFSMPKMMKRLATSINSVTFTLQ